MLNSLAPFRKLLFDFSNAALVISLSTEVRAPAIPEPAIYDWISSGHIKDKSPTNPPLTVASARPKEATIVHKTI
jgi:hypothetical protein